MVADLADLSALPPTETQYGSDPALLAAELRAHITAAANSSPRSLQQAIGPSEIGTPCAAKIGYKLAQVKPSNVGGDVLRPTIGTAMHGWLADTFAHANAGLPVARWLVENRVHVASLPCGDVDGNCDLFDRLTATALDWKVTTLAKIRNYRANGPGEQYRVQAQAYALGWANRGVHVERVAVMFLPRDGVLSQAHLWSEPYAPDVALQALARLQGIAAALQLVSVDAVLRSLPRAPDYCTYCPFYARGATDRAVACPGAA